MPSCKMTQTKRADGIIMGAIGRGGGRCLPIAEPSVHVCLLMTENTTIGLTATFRSNRLKIRFYIPAAWCSTCRCPSALWPKGSQPQLITSPTDILYVCLQKPGLLQPGWWNTICRPLGDSHAPPFLPCVAVPSHADRGRAGHQSFTNSFKCERVLVVSAKGVLGGY